jgi:hypothetical protein
MTLQEHSFFTSLLCHKSNSGIGAQWHCLAISHGKGPSDVAVGTTEQQAPT